MSHPMPHNDFDAVTGPSMPPRPAPSPQRPDGPDAAASVLPPPARAPADTEQKGR